MREVRRVLAWNPGGGLDLRAALADLRAARPKADLAVWTDAVAPGALPGLLARLEEGRFDAAVIFTARGASPFEAAFLAHLAGVPVRAGASVEFGGGVLAPWLRPPPHGTEDADAARALVRATLAFVSDVLSVRSFDRPEAP